MNAQRAEALARALGADGQVDATDQRHVWLALAVLTGRLPDEHAVVETARAARFDLEALSRAVHAAVAGDAAAAPAVVVATGRVVVDVPATQPPATHRALLATGLARAWERDHGALPVRWDDVAQAFVTDTLVTDTLVAGSGEPVVVVPWRSRVVLPFPDGSADRTDRLRALARFSGNAVAAVDAGLSAVTAAEEHAPEQTTATARMLTVLRHAGRVATVSPTAHLEYEGWRRTVAAIGLAGPDIVAVVPAAPRLAPGDPVDPGVEARFRVGTLPLVAVVGAPPHLQRAVLRAADRLWATGHRFALTLLTEHTAPDPDTARHVAHRQRHDLPVDLVTGAGPAVVRAALEHARLALCLAPSASAALDLAAARDAGTPAVVRSAGARLDALLPAGVHAVDTRQDDAVHDAIAALLGGHDAPALTATSATPPHAQDLAGFATEVWHALRCHVPLSPREATTPPRGEDAATTHPDDVGTDDVGNDHP